MREFIRKLPKIETVLELAVPEFAGFLLDVMRQRSSDPIAAKPNPEATMTELLDVYSSQISALSRIDVQRQLNRMVRAAWAWLDKAELIEPAEGINGKNGYWALTDAGSAGEIPDAEQIHLRSLLRPEMLHPPLRDAVYDDYRNGRFGTAVHEAFKAVEIAVRTAARYPNSEFGQPMIQKAFEKNGPLTLPGEIDSHREALRRLFSGALGIFKNPNSHANPNIAVSAAMQEIMTASRLLAILEERQHEIARLKLKRPKPAP